jgi:hypothetical protein
MFHDADGDVCGEFSPLESPRAYDLEELVRVSFANSERPKLEDCHI